MDWLVALISRSGAATVTSPSVARLASSARSPGAWMPSSLVNRMRFGAIIRFGIIIHWREDEKGAAIGEQAKLTSEPASASILTGGWCWGRGISSDVQ